MENTAEKIIEVMPIRDQLADILRRMILSGEFSAGQQLSERQLCAQFNVSTTPVKEALRMLQAEGLVYSVQRKGTFVSSVPKNSAMQLVAMRGALEGVAARFAAENCTLEEIQRMEELLCEAEHLLEEADPDWKRYSELNTEYHAILRDGSRNNYLVSMIESLSRIDNTIRKISYGARTARALNQVSQKEHREILEAVRRRDGNEAERRMNLHVRMAVERVLEMEK